MPLKTSTALCSATLVGTNKKKTFKILHCPACGVYVTARNMGLAAFEPLHPAALREINNLYRCQ